MSESQSNQGGVFCLAIYLRDPEGISSESARSIWLEVESLRPSHVLSLPPHGIEMSFAGPRLYRFGTTDSAIETIQKRFAVVPGLFVGWSIGSAIGRINDDGIFVLGPLGDVLSDAMKMAVREGRNRGAERA